MKLLILSALLLTGCVIPEEPYRTVQLQSGEVVECRQLKVEYCGVNLWECKNGIQYACQANTQIINSGEVK